jgi:hypothetical protein
MLIHLFRDQATDIYALSVDPTGRNLPRRVDTTWEYLETLDPFRLAWGKAEFEKAREDLRVWGWFAFHGQAISNEDMQLECESGVRLRLRPH